MTDILGIGVCSSSESVSGEKFRDFFARERFDHPFLLETEKLW